MGLFQIEDNLFTFNVKVFARYGRWTGSDKNPWRLVLLFFLGAALLGPLIPGVLYAEKETDIDELCTLPGARRGERGTGRPRRRPGKRADEAGPQNARSRPGQRRREREGEGGRGRGREGMMASEREANRKRKRKREKERERTIGSGSKGKLKGEKTCGVVSPSPPLLHCALLS